MDMVFSVRQLVEKSREHNERLFITIVDLKRHMTPSQGRHCGRY